MERENKAMKRFDHLTTACLRAGGAQSSISGVVVVGFTELTRSELVITVSLGKLVLLARR